MVGRPLTGTIAEEVRPKIELSPAGGVPAASTIAVRGFPAIFFFLIEPGVVLAVCWLVTIVQIVFRSFLSVNCKLKTRPDFGFGIDPALGRAIRFEGSKCHVFAALYTESFPAMPP